MDLTVSVETQGVSTVAHVRGELDAHTAPVLRSVLSDLADQGATDVIVSLRDVTFVDSSGLGVLVGGLKRLRTVGGTLRLAAINERVLRVVRITGLDTVFEIHPDVSCAVGVD
ncbi:hypothetical protein GCM10009547_34500 [Sporichthya brevicatena]|uniref:Anti-sigma factor antagonist n=1 Tax=Sporichthya brevicatena TaxID=171442 RepID=A0ABN1H3F0_9ACTN